MKICPGRRVPLAGVRAVLIGILVGLSLAGCSANTQMTKPEENNFKGGPMPPGFLETHRLGTPASRVPASVIKPPPASTSPK